MRFVKSSVGAQKKRWPAELAGRGRGGVPTPPRVKQEGIAKPSAFDPLVVKVLTAAMDGRRSRLLDFTVQQLRAALQVCQASGLYTADCEDCIGWAISKVADEAGAQ